MTAEKRAVRERVVDPIVHAGWYEAAEVDGAVLYGRPGCGADRLRGTALASGVVLVGVCAAITDVPVFTSTRADWVAAGAVALGTLIAVRKGSVPGTAEQLAEAVWLLGKVFAAAVVSGVFLPVVLVVGIPAALVADTVS